MYAIAVCLNPARDMVVSVKGGFEPGKTNRADSVVYSAGGKGINVARALKNTGAECVVVGFAGGATGEYIREALYKEKIEFLFVKTGAETRTNIKILNEDCLNNEYTEINSPGGPVTAEETEALVEKVWKTASQMCENREKSEEGYLVLSGSSPQGVDKLVYNSIIGRVRELDLKVICDCDGILLKNVMKASPYLIKPNETELSSLVGENFSTIETACEKCDELSSQTGINILLSLGARGAYYSSGGKGVFSPAAEIPKCNPNGAGDTLLAAFLSGLSKIPEKNGTNIWYRAVSEELENAQSYVRKTLLSR
ncbi:MAG: hexose kinase [Oscillospiraceae bacterium]|nr:hexose kinase [Oscillospiraceae bacterium]